jgi:Cof subfamily protein (haloacid dehalogenase superfamily)
MVNYRALAIDLDGTLLTPDEQVSSRNAAAVRAALDQGFEVIVATARWYRMAGEVASMFGLAGPAIACSGAQVRRLGDGMDLLDLRLPPAFARALYEICDSQRCVATVALDDDVVVKLDGNPDLASLPAGLRSTPSLAATLPAVPRIALIQGTAVNRNIVESLADQWADRVRFVESISSAGKTILTLTSVGADKGVALRSACADLGLDPGEVVAIGDADNDIEMFRVAGASFAMGQASPTVQAAATAVTAPNAQDGVALAIEQVLAGQLG